MNTQKQHEQSGCTDYLQHNADACPHVAKRGCASKSDKRREQICRERADARDKKADAPAEVREELGGIYWE